MYKFQIQELSEARKEEQNFKAVCHVDENILSDQNNPGTIVENIESTIPEQLSFFHERQSFSSYKYDSSGPACIAYNGVLSSGFGKGITLSLPENTLNFSILSKQTIEDSTRSGSSTCLTESSAHDHNVELMYQRLRQNKGDPAEIVEKLSHSSASSSGFSQFTRDSSFEDCSECEVLDGCIPSKNSLDFWRAIDRSTVSKEGCHIKLFAKLLSKLEEVFPKEKQHLSRDIETKNLLKSLLKVNLSDEAATVDYKNFVRIVTFFGPIRYTDDGRCILIQQLQDVAKNSLRLKNKRTKEKISWFAGDISRDEAESKLENQKYGTYLIRMSGTLKGCFIISVIDEDSCIHHFEIEGDYRSAAKSNPFSACLKLHGNTYHSLVEVEESLMTEPLTDEEEQIFCRHICPGLPLNVVIKGYKKSGSHSSDKKV